MDELLEIIQELSPQYKIVFNLFAIEGYSHKEIAEMLNVSEGTSKSQFARARKLLKEKIAEHKEKAEKKLAKKAEEEGKTVGLAAFGNERNILKKIENKNWKAGY